MRVFIHKLEDAGIAVIVDKNMGTIDFLVEHDNEDARDMIREACSVMGFNDVETETVFGEVHRVSIMSAIRRCSNW